MANDMHTPSAEFAANAHADEAKYREMYAASIADPDAFWGEQGKRLDWIKPYSKVKNTTYTHPDVSIKWYEDGVLNVAANCVDRHLATRGDQTAIIWESDDPSVDQSITYSELHEKVCKLSNVYKSLGVGKGDRVVLYIKYSVSMEETVYRQVHVPAYLTLLQTHVAFGGVIDFGDVGVFCQNFFGT